MSCGFVLALLIASIGSLEVQAEKNEGVTATPNGHHGVLLGALTVQKNNRFVTGPNDKNLYGSVVKMENTIDSSDPSNTRTLTAIAPGGPGHEGMSFVWTGDELEDLNQAAGNGVVLGAVTIQEGNTYDSEPGSEIQYGSVVEQSGNVYHFNGSPSNGVPLHLGAVTIQRGNHFSPSAGSKNYFGSRLYQRDNVYDFS